MDSLNVKYAAQALGVGAPLLMSGVFFGASHLTIPPLLKLSIKDATQAFAFVYHTGAGVQGTLAATGIVSTAIAAYLSPERRLEYEAIGAGIASPIIFTLVFMAGGINRLLAIQSMNGSEVQSVRKEEVIGLLKTWQSQNYLRAGIAFAAGAYGMYNLFHSSRGQAGKAVQ